MNKILTVTKLHLKNLKVAYVITGVSMAVMVIQTLIYYILALNGVYVSEEVVTGVGISIEGQMSIGAGVYAWLIPILAAIFIPAYHFRRTMNLGGKRGSFLAGSFITYSIIALAVSFVNMLFFYTVESALVYGEHVTSVNLIELFGWTQYGLVITFFRQAAFLLLLMVVLHTLTSIQTRWYGWVTDLVIAAIIAVFVPIEPLRNFLQAFFEIVIFQSNSLLHIVVCVAAAAGIYALNQPIYARKTI